MDTILSHPLWSKFFAGLLAFGVTGTLAFALNTRDAVKDHETRLTAVEKSIVDVAAMKSDLAVLRDRSDRAERERNDSR